MTGAITNSVRAGAVVVTPPRRGPSLRLLFAANVSADPQTGMGNLLVSLAAALERRGHQIDFLLREDLPGAARAGRLARFAFPWQVASEVRRRMARGIHYDAINVHEPSGMICAMRRRWSERFPPVVITSQGIEQRGWELRAEGSRRTLKTRIAHPATQLVQANYALRHADAVCCVSSEDAEFVEKRLGVARERIHRLSNGCDPELFELEWGGGAQPELLFVGTWIERKGKRELARAFARLRETRPWLRLRVLGAGLLPEGVRADFGAKDREAVEVLPRVARKDLARWLARDQVFVLPSHFEGMPLSLLEAMAAGLPCVTTNVCGMRDLIRDGENGFLVPPGDAEALAARAEALLDSATLRVRVGAAGRETTRKRTWDHVAADWEAAFTQVAEQRPRRFLLQDGRWSDENVENPQQRLAGKLVGLSDELERSGDPCQEMARWAPLHIRGRILDIGCGTGWKSHCLEQTNGNRAVAYDFDAKLLAEARERFALERLVQGDAQALPFRSASFDWVLAIEVIEHLRRPAEFLAEVERVLRPGGKLVLTTPNRLQYLRPWRPRMFYRGLRGRIVLEPSHVREFDGRELASLLPRSLRATRLRHVGTLFGWPVPVRIEEVPQPFQRWWAQGLELVAEKVEPA